MSVGTVHADAETTTAASGDEIAVSVAEADEASDDVVAGSVVSSDVLKDERSLDEMKESVDASATRNQRESIKQTELNVVSSEPDLNP